MAFTCRILSCLLLLVPPCLAAQAQTGPAELIVLLPPAADPPIVVGRINEGLSLPYGLETGDPTGARLFLPDRPTGRTLDWILHNPSSALAMLHRYIVIEYPAPTDTLAVQTTLQAGGQLLSVEPNLDFELSAPVVPNDLYFGSFLGDPNFSQWAHHLMGFPDAWQWATGHAQIGVVDQGIEVGHPEFDDYLLTAPGGPWTWLGGNLRTQRSFSVVRDPDIPGNQECLFDERDARDFWAGHGTHVAGLIAARTNNTAGVAGACWNCSLQIAKAFENQSSPSGAVTNAGQAAIQLVAQGAQLLSFSFGLARADYPACGPGAPAAMCNLLQLISERHVVVAASSGNDRTAVEFPATEPAVLGVGGVQRTQDPPYYSLWNEVACTDPEGDECGSNYGSTLDLVAPAKSVLSTLYNNWNHNPLIPCGDRADMPGIPADGLGICTGTSMSTPLVVGLAGILRSVSPLLTHTEIADILTSTATQAGNRTDTLGFGVPRAELAVLRALGRSGGQPINNRLTPLFSLKSVANVVHYYTPAPQDAAALTFDPDDPFDSFGPEVAGYSLPGACTIGPCPPNPATAAFYVFTSTRLPFQGSPALVPVYRLRFDPKKAALCANAQPLPPLSSRRFAYAITSSEISYFRNVIGAQGAGYEADGILGWVYPWCEPNLSCRPPGTLALYRLYNSEKDDWALVTELERTSYEENGYHTTQTFAGVGFVYGNVDTDADLLIDGWEGLLGTSSSTYDTDCDGLSDGFEVRGYRSTGSPEAHGYRDPLDGPCSAIFWNGFETGDTSGWSFTSFVDDGINF